MARIIGGPLALRSATRAGATMSSGGRLAAADLNPHGYPGTLDTTTAPSAGNVLRLARSARLARSQADVDRRRFSWTDLDSGGVGFEAVMLNFDPVGPLGDFNQQAVLALGSVPTLAVNQNGRVGRLDANRQRPV